MILERMVGRLFGRRVRLIQMSAETERSIIGEMGKIGRIKDFLELHVQAGYQLFARTKDERYLGYVELANTFLKGIEDAQRPKEVESDDSGYDSTV